MIEHEAAASVGDLGEHRRQVELLDRQHLDRDQAHHDADRAALAEDRRAEPAALRERVGDVDLGEAAREVDGDAAILEDHPGDRLGVGRGQRRDLDRAEQLAVEPVVRRVPDLEVDVRDAALDAESQELVKRVAVHRERRNSRTASV